MLRLPPLSGLQRQALAHAERVLLPETFDELGWPRVRQVDEILLAWGKGPIAAGTEVLMADGTWTTHEKLSVGDRIIGGDGQPCEVTAVFPTVWEDCWRMTFTDGSEVVSTGRHRWPMYKHDRPRIGTTEEIAGSVTRSHGQGRRSRQWVQEYVGATFEADPDLLIDPWCLGHWLGDGLSNHAGITVSSDDQDEIIPHYESAGYRLKKYGQWGKSVRYGVADFLWRMRELDLRGNKHIPPEYLRASREDRIALLSGLLDSDGSISDKGRITFHNTNPRLIEGVEELLTGLGIGWTKREDVREGRKTCWSLQFVTYEQVFRLRRKAQKIKQRPVLRRPMSQARRVASCEPVETVPANCIRVSSPDNTYLVGRGLIRTCNSGKDLISRVILSRIVYILHCLVSPQAYFGMPATETIAMTNIAMSSSQAKNAFFDPWVNMIEQSPFYSRISDPKSRSIQFDKNILALSGHSETKSQEGQNLLVAVLDEFAEFKTPAELTEKKMLSYREPAQSAEGIYNMAKSSITSRFSRTGKLIIISYTRFAGDPVDSRVTEAETQEREEGEAKRIFYSRAATWEVNPIQSKEFFDKEYERDPFAAQALYECKPSASAYSFFPNMLAVRQSMGILDLSINPATREPDHTIGIRYYWGEDPKDTSGSPRGRKVEGWQVEFDFSGLVPHRRPIAIHMDLGLVHSRAGVAGSHVEGSVSRTEQEIDQDSGVLVDRVFRRPQVVTDFVIAFEARRGDPNLGHPPSDVQIRWIQQLVTELIANGWFIARFTADGYQSTYILQIMEQWGIEADKYSLDTKTEGYDTLKNVIYEQTVSAPFHPILYEEIKALVKITGTKVDHPMGGSKDMSDAWAGSVVGAIETIEKYGWGNPPVDTQDLSEGFGQFLTEEQFRGAAPVASPGEYGFRRAIPSGPGPRMY